MVTTVRYFLTFGNRYSNFLSRVVMSKAREDFQLCIILEECLGNEMFARHSLGFLKKCVSSFNIPLLNLYHVSDTALGIEKIKWMRYHLFPWGEMDLGTLNGKSKKPLGLNDIISQTIFSFSLTGRDWVLLLFFEFPAQLWAYRI